MRPPVQLLISCLVVLCVVVPSEASGLKVRWRVAVRLLLVNRLILLLNRLLSTGGDVYHALERTHRRTGRVAPIGAWARYRAHPYAARCRMVVLCLTVPRWRSLELLDARNMVELWMGKCSRILRVA